MVESLSNAGPVVLPDPLPDTIAECQELIVRFWYRILELEKRSRRNSRDVHGPTSARVDADDLEGEGKEVYEATCKKVEEERQKLGQPPPSEHGGGGRQAPLHATDEEKQHHRIVDEANLLCPCCMVLCSSMGFKVSYQLSCIPARYKRIKHIEYSYACPKCDYIIEATKPLQPIDKGYADASLISQIIQSKFEYHLPLYRQEQIFMSHSIPIDRSSMSRWLQTVAVNKLKRLYDRMKVLILKCLVINADETNMPFIRKGAGKTITGKISIYRGDEIAPYNLYNFTEDGRGDNHTRFLPGYRGYLLTDGTAVFNGVLADPEEPREGATSATCLAHVYRYWEDAKKAEDKLADYPIGVIKAVFKIEDLAANLSEKGRVALRQEMTKPLLDNLKCWLDRQQLSAAPTAFADAIRYTLNRWPSLTQFVDHGFLKAHNNDAENGLRPVVLGRGNWLFMGSADGGQTAAILMSFVQTCRRLKIDSFEYLTDVLTRLPGSPTDDIDQFLPDRWKAARNAAKQNQPEAA